jgi:hypothetical protein
MSILISQFDLMMRKIVRTSFIPAVVILLAGPALSGPITDTAALHALAARPAIEFVVGGVSRDFNDRDWTNQVIAEGISQLVVDEFKSDSRFVSLEDDPEIRDIVREFVAATWFGKELPQGKSLLDPNDAGEKLVITARLSDFHKTKSSSFGFGVGSATVTISVAVELEFSLGGKPILTSRGVGTGKTVLDAVIFKIAGDRISFDATTVGAAVRQAVHTAAQEALKAFGT